jgi:predicted nucleic acid-binding Zn ribbon protein
VFVYFIGEEPDGPVKIGVANDPEARVGLLQIGNPRTLTLLAASRGGIRYERELHERFSAWRLRGEWFDRHAEGLQEVITEALHLETLATVHDMGWCPVCERRPLVPPRIKFCSEACATQRAQERSRDWRRSARKGKNPK